MRKKVPAKRIKKRATDVKFTCLVDADLMRQANEARTVTWRDIIEDAFTEVIATANTVKKLKALGSEK